MSNTPEQDAYLALLRLPHNGPRSTQAMQSAMATLRDHIAEASGKDPELVQSLAEQVTAFEASRAAPEFGPLDPAAMDLGTWRPDAAPDDVVERVARAICAAFPMGWDGILEAQRDHLRDLARAAIAAYLAAVGG